MGTYTQNTIVSFRIAPTCNSKNTDQHTRQAALTCKTCIVKQVVVPCHTLMLNQHESYKHLGSCSNPFRTHFNIQQQITPIPNPFQTHSKLRTRNSSDHLDSYCLPEDTFPKVSKNAGGKTLAVVDAEAQENLFKMNETLKARTMQDAR